MLSFHLFNDVMVLEMSRMSFIHYKRILLLVLTICLILPCGCSKRVQNDSSFMTEKTTSDTETSTLSIESSNEQNSLEVHFIDVGQGDASLIICDGHAMLIDGGPAKQSDLMYAYLKKYDISHLDYIIATHPDDDHIGGLSGALQYADADHAFCPVTEHDTYTFKSFEENLQSRGISIECPASGSTFELGKSSCTVLGPIDMNSEKTNNLSIVIRMQYGNTSFLFTGDAEQEEEDLLLNSDQELRSDVLRVAHHGSEYSTSDRFLSAVHPQYAVISCGKDNTFGFPTKQTLERLAGHGVTLYRTDLQGDIIVRSDGEVISVETEKTTSEDLFTAPELLPSEEDDGQEHDYVLNVKSKKFHRPECDAVNKMDEKNRKQRTATREELLNEGYSPCKMCKP